MSGKLIIHFNDTRATIAVAGLLFIIFPCTFIATKQWLLCYWSVSFLSSPSTGYGAGIPCTPLTPCAIYLTIKKQRFELCLIIYWSMLTIPGQPLLLQVCCSWSSPEHSLPPYKACCVIDLFLPCVPPPHVTEHVSHALHWPHVQFTEQLRSKGLNYVW